MSSAEIRERARQEIYKRVDLARYSLHAVPKIISTAAVSAPSFFFTPQQLPEICRLLLERFPEQVEDIVNRAEKICAHRFDLLGYENLDYGLKIDWHLDRVHSKRAALKPWYRIRYLDFAEVGDVKITWELNRHQHLVTLAKGYIITQDERFAKELIAQWYDWVEQNPYPMGVNWTSSLEVAFRAMSWLWVKHLLGGRLVLTQKFKADLTQALWLSGCHIARYLSTYFSPNTHLLGEGVGLFFLGVLCPELRDAAQWKHLGWKIVLQEAEHQVRPDGIHFEQSSYYHVYALDFFLHAVLLAARNDIEIPQQFERTIEKMLEALLLSSQAEVSPRFGDDDGGRVFDPRRNCAEHMRDPLATGAVLFGRGDFKAAADGLREEAVWLVGDEGVARFDGLIEDKLTPRSVAFAHSGLYVMAGSSISGSVQLIIDAGPQGSLSGGHSHADVLSLQVAQAGHELLVDPGTCEYIGQDSTRNVFRGIAAHNTVQIDGRNPSMPTGPFSWERMINPQVNQCARSENFDLLVGSYESHGVLHRRYVCFCKPEFWLVRDVVEGTGKHRITVSWHLAPGMAQHQTNPRLFLSPNTSVGIGLLTSDSSWQDHLIRGVWSPVYGRKEPAPVLRVERDTFLPTEIATALVPTTDAQSLGTLSQLHDNVASSRTLRVYSYTGEDTVHCFFFSVAPRIWSFQSWSSDAEFLYFREHRSGVRTIAFSNGTQLSFNGRQVLFAKEKIHFCEVISPERRIISHQKDVIVLGSWPEIKTKEALGALNT